MVRCAVKVEARSFVAWVAEETHCRAAVEIPDSGIGCTRIIDRPELVDLSWRSGLTASIAEDELAVLSTPDLAVRRATAPQLPESKADCWSRNTSENLLGNSPS